MKFALLMVIFIGCCQPGLSQLMKTSKAQLLCAEARTNTTKRQFEKAEELYRKALEEGTKDPCYALAKVGLARVLAEQKEFSESEQLLNDFIRETSTDQNLPGVRLGREELKSVLLQENKLSEANKIEQVLKDKHCPICGSDSKTKPVAYGFRPEMSSDEKKRVHVMGCTVPFEEPHWWCESDNTLF